MSRLLFSAARGARIDRREFNERAWWTTYQLDIHKGSAAADCVYRIHPDDAHLQYGPISSALREFAAGNVNRPEDDTHWRIARDYYSHAAGAGFYTLEEPSLFLLFLAEALADEGL